MHGLQSKIGTNVMMKFKKVIVNTQNSFFGVFGDKSYTFYELNDSHYYQHTYKPEIDAFGVLFGVSLIENEEYSIFKREVLTVWDVFAETGGFLEIITILGVLVTFHYTNFHTNFVIA